MSVKKILPDFNKKKKEKKKWLTWVMMSKGEMKMYV